MAYAYDVNKEAVGGACVQAQIHAHESDSDIFNVDELDSRLICNHTEVPQNRNKG